MESGKHQKPTLIKEKEMRIYKELSFVGEKPALDEFKRNAPSFATGDWKYVKSDRMKDYIAFDYNGNEADHAEVSIYYGADAWREGYIKVGNIVPLQKDRLSIEEYNAVLDLFYAEIILPNQRKMENIEIVGPESDVFDPLKYISKEALEKLERFCDCANKTTGSAHPSDGERWFDFICQTVDDNQTLDYDTLYRFLMDEEYWGKKGTGFLGCMGHFAWDESHAAELALEYDSYVRILEYYKNRKRKEEYEAAQK